MKLKFLQIGIIIIALVFASCNKQNTNKNVTLTNELDSISYSLGVDIASNFKRFGIKDIDIDAFTIGFAQVITEDSTQISELQAKKEVQKFVSKLQNLKLQENLIKGQDFLKENKNKKGIVTTASGLQYKILKKGEGAVPTSKDVVMCHYQGTLINGDVFDSSYKRGKPSTFAVSAVVKGWQEALQLMHVGAKWKIFIPSELAYGKRAQRTIKPNSTIIFEMELIKILSEEDIEKEKNKNKGKRRVSN